jgi:hypothetical protein
MTMNLDTQKVYVKKKAKMTFYRSFLKTWKTPREKAYLAESLVTIGE